MSKRKTKFSVNQPVAFRYGDKKMIGRVSLIKPIGKQFVYNVIGENGKEYDELSVDTVLNACIDTYLTKLFYKKYDIPEEHIPVKDTMKSSAGIYLPEGNNPETETEVAGPEVEVRDYAVDYDEENPDYE
jgi:hypothetical protein